MPQGTTPNFGFLLPTVGGDKDAWGAELNSNWLALDTLLAQVSPTQSISVQLEAATLYALDSAPASLLVSPGPGFAAVVDRIDYYYKFGTVPFSTLGSPTLDVKYTSGGAIDSSVAVGSLLVTPTQNLYRTSRPNVLNLFTSQMINCGIQVSIAPGTNIADGDGSLVISLAYRVVPLT